MLKIQNNGIIKKTLKYVLLRSVYNNSEEYNLFFKMFPCKMAKISLKFEGYSRYYSIHPGHIH